MNMYVNNEQPSAVFDLLRAGKVAHLGVAYVSVRAKYMAHIAYVLYTYTYIHSMYLHALPIHAPTIKIRQRYASHKTTSSDFPNYPKLTDAHSRWFPRHGENENALLPKRDLGLRSLDAGYLLTEIPISSVRATESARGLNVRPVLLKSAIPVEGSPALIAESFTWTLQVSALWLCTRPWRAESPRQTYPVDCPPGIMAQSARQPTPSGSPSCSRAMLLQRVEFDAMNLGWSLRVKERTVR